MCVCVFERERWTISKQFRKGNSQITSYVRHNLVYSTKIALCCKLYSALETLEKYIANALVKQIKTSWNTKLLINFCWFSFLKQKSSLLLQMHAVEITMVYCGRHLSIPLNTWHTRQVVLLSEVIDSNQQYIAVITPNEQ